MQPSAIDRVAAACSLCLQLQFSLGSKSGAGVTYNIGADHPRNELWLQWANFFKKRKLSVKRTRGWECVRLKHLFFSFLYILRMCQRQSTIFLFFLFLYKKYTLTHFWKHSSRCEMIFNPKTNTICSFFIYPKIFTEEWMD